MEIPKGLEVVSQGKQCWCPDVYAKSEVPTPCDFMERGEEGKASYTAGAKMQCCVFQRWPVMPRIVRMQGSFWRAPAELERSFQMRSRGSLKARGEF